MATQHVVVDGSNIATEGRSTPSLDQLEGAVAELRKEFPDAEMTVVVDATFAHRIDPSELQRYEQAALRGEMISPPAGAIGRGDAFLLRIAEKVDAMVLSNDSFQEFHGEHAWLFDRGRLLGATPVPGIGWIFVPRTPVRGPKSRVAVRDATRARARVEKAIAEATKEAVAPTPPAEPEAKRRRQAAGSPQAVNDPSTFIAFIAEHRLGEELEAEVESFSSHGAVVRYGEVRCYVPLSGLGTPPPRSAREVLHKGEVRTFCVTALDPYRRGVELALPGVAVVSGHPSPETVAAEVRMARAGRRGAAEEPAAPRARRRRAAAGGTEPREEVAPAAPAAEEAPAGRRRRRATAEQGAHPVAPETPAPETPAAAAPAPRRRRRATAEQGVPAVVAETPAAAAPGRAPRKRAAKTVSAAPTPEPAPTPVAATRTRTAKKAAARPAEPAAEAPAPRPRTRKAATVAPAPAGAPQPERPARATGARKAAKKAVTAEETPRPAVRKRAAKKAPAAEAAAPPAPRKRAAKKATGAAKS